MKTATILTIIGLVLSFGAGAALWTHDHSSKLPLANEKAVEQQAMAERIGDQLRVYDSRVHDFRMTIRRMQDRVYNLETIIPENPKILKTIRELNIEIEGDQRLLDQLQKKILYEEKQKQSLTRSPTIS